jgi:hypothetical protein
LIVTLGYGELLNHWSDVGDIGYYGITVKVTDANSHIFSKGFDFAITDIDDTAPTDIQLSNNTLVKGQVTDTLIGTLSAHDVDTATLSFSVSDTTSFKIDGDKLKV